MFLIRFLDGKIKRFADGLRFLPDQHLEMCEDGVLSCESKEFSGNNHDSDAGKGLLGFLSSLIFEVSREITSETEFSLILHW